MRVLLFCFEQQMKVELSGHYTKRRILRTVWPCMLTMMVASVYSVVDGLFISNFTGTTSFAAINLVMPVLMMVGALGMMVGTGGSALVAKILGEGSLYKARKVFSMLVYFAIGMGAIASVLLILFMRPIAMLLGADDAMIDTCVLYGRIYASGMVFFILQLMFQSLFMTAELPQLGTMLTVACGVINMALDALFVGLLGWGVTGAGLATLIAMAVGGLFPLLYFASHRNRSRLKLVHASLNWRHIGQSCLNGSSEFVANIAISLCSVCYNIQLMHYVGENGVAAYGVMMYVGYVFVAVLQGYNIGITPIVGYHYGAQNHPELCSLLRKSFIILAVADTTLCLLAEMLAGPFSAIFVGYDPELLAFTTRAFHLNATAFVLCGFTYFVGTFFTALNNGAVSAIISFTRTLVFEMACVWTLPLLLGIDGIWLSWTVSEVLALGLCLGLLWKYRNKYHYL